MANIELITQLYYSFGAEDFNYNVRLNQLKYIKELGKGGFGVVNLMYDGIKKSEVAVKFLDFNNSSINSQLLKKEVIALSNLDHLGIVSLVDSFPHN